MPRRRFLEAMLAITAAGPCLVGACGAAEATASAGATVIDSVFVFTWADESGAVSADAERARQLAEAVQVSIAGSAISHTKLKLSPSGGGGAAVAIELE